MGNTCSSNNYDGESSKSMLFEGHETPPPPLSGCYSGIALMRRKEHASRKHHRWAEGGKCDSVQRSLFALAIVVSNPCIQYSWSTESGYSVNERFQTLTLRRGFKPELLIDLPPGFSVNT